MFDEKELVDAVLATADFHPLATFHPKVDNSGFPWWWTIGCGSSLGDTPSPRIGVFPPQHVVPGGQARGDRLFIVHRILRHEREVDGVLERVSPLLHMGSLRWGE